MPAQFWKMTPLAMHRHVQGYRRNVDRMTYQWRETYVQYHNAHCEEGKTTTGEKVWRLPIDDEQEVVKPKKVRAAKRISQAIYDRQWAIANQSPIAPNGISN